MNSWKVLAAHCIAALVIASVAVSSAQAGAFIGPTEEMYVEIVEYAGVDSSKPATPSNSLTVHGDRNSSYAFVKMDLSKLPPIENIFIVSAYLSFHIDGWHGTGELGYASVHSHYCEDDSWTSATLTWKNKPTFRSEVTDAWGFFSYYSGDRLDFTITGDVVRTLESGDNLLTEVITWGSGTGTTTLGDPKLKIVYATRPVYKLRLDTVCDAPDVNITKTKLMKIGVANQIFGGDSYTPEFPRLEYAYPGTYDLKFQGRCKFSGWQTDGGVSVSNSSQPLTQLTIDSDGGLTAKCSLDWVIYGDEDSGARSAFESFRSSESYAEKYSPLVSGYLRIVRVYVMKDPVPFELHILNMSDYPPKKAPIDMTPAVKVQPTRIGWAEVDLSSQKIRVERDHAYYVSITWLTDNKPVFDEGPGTEGQERYAFRKNTWEYYNYPDMLIQHIVSRTLEETVSFPKISASTTTIPPTETSTGTTTTMPEASFLFQAATGVVVLILVIGAIGFGAYRVTKRRRPATVPSEVAASAGTLPFASNTCRNGIFFR
jgi:hypothetical protein